MFMRDKILAFSSCSGYLVLRRSIHARPPPEQREAGQLTPRPPPSSQAPFSPGGVAIAAASASNSQLSPPPFPIPTQLPFVGTCHPLPATGLASWRCGIRETDIRQYNSGSGGQVEEK